MKLTYLLNIELNECNRINCDTYVEKLQNIGTQSLKHGLEKSSRQ